MNYNRKDSGYRQAKEQGYRSRAALKLIEINRRFNIIGKKSRVLDLGCWPGGWLQVASEIAQQGSVIGVDLQATEPMPAANVRTIIGDLSDESTLSKISDLGRELGQSEQTDFDVVLSDMAPKLSGIREADEANCGHCNDLALSVAKRMLTKDGAFVVKVFKNPTSDSFVKSLRSMFNSVTREELDSSRKTSNEYYCIARGFKAG